MSSQEFLNKVYYKFVKQYVDQKGGDLIILILLLIIVLTLNRSHYTVSTECDQALSTNTFRRVEVKVTVLLPCGCNV